MVLVLFSNNSFTSPFSHRHLFFYSGQPEPNTIKLLNVLQLAKTAASMEKIQIHKSRSKQSLKRGSWCKR